MAVTVAMRIGETQAAGKMNASDEDPATNWGYFIKRRSKVLFVDKSINVLHVGSIKTSIYDTIPSYHGSIQNDWQQFFFQYMCDVVRDFHLGMFTIPKNALKVKIVVLSVKRPCSP